MAASYKLFSTYWQSCVSYIRNRGTGVTCSQASHLLLCCFSVFITSLQLCKLPLHLVITHNVDKDHYICTIIHMSFDLNLSTPEALWACFFVCMYVCVCM